MNVAARNLIIIEAGFSERRYWQDLWRYRELLYFLAWRDILVRYRQTAIGATWAILRPLFTMIIFSIVFGRIAKLPSAGLPYPLLVLSGMLPWQFFANALGESGNSLVLNSGLITKVFFPRMLIPFSAMVVAFVDFAITLVILAGMLMWYQILPSYRLLFLPTFMLLAVMLSLGLGLLVAALNVKFRDFRYVTPFLLQLGLYTSPVGFTSSVVTSKWRVLYSINPMVSVIDGFRWSIFGTEPLYGSSLFISALSCAVLLIIGVFYFRRTENAFADVI